MTQPLITTTELTLRRPARWQLTLRIVLTAIAAGGAAFVLTWVVLAWPTLVARLGWTIDHTAGVNLTALAPAAAVDVAANHLVIPAIHVDAPVFYNTAITDAVGRLPDGVVHVQGTADPGATGDVFIVGHSSGYWWQAGRYTQVFVLLDKLQSGDAVLINHDGTTYRYQVTSREVVAPSALDELDQPTNRHELSVMTCTPVGTSLRRLIVHADLVTQAK